MRSDVRVDGMGEFSDIAKYGDAFVGCSEQSFMREGLIQVEIEASPSCVADVVKGVVRVLKTFQVDNLEDAKQRAKLNIVRNEAERAPSREALERSIRLLAGREKGAVLAAIDNVTASRVEAAASRFVSNISIAALGNIDNVPPQRQSPEMDGIDLSLSSYFLLLSC
ncbi:hypothetical protein PMAYCL1PPCAC_20139 [Pristionchus mayeri]|uniref:Uncharacterized protein n=1 Tax=Pristionchus mayeri TaxID=1317129 RepID=A0AAN5CTA5_9BILA|nr:hypothetical protein PMAYCL1PPCAC_20139 [Pristionchus mayeri]